MNRNEFNRFIVGIGFPGPADIEGLRELTSLFPWFHSAHLMLLKGLKENSDIRFDAQLKASALSVSDREVLYHYIYLSPGDESAGRPVEMPGESVEPDAAAGREELAAAGGAPADVTPEEAVAADTGEEPEEPAAAVTGGEIEEAATGDEHYPEAPPEAPVPADTGEEPAEEAVAAETGEEPAAGVVDKEPVAAGNGDEETPTVADERRVAVAGEEEYEVESASELPVEEAPGAGPDSGIRSREELVAEIESRLRELEMIAREQISRAEAEQTAGEVDASSLAAAQPETVVAGEDDKTPFQAEEIHSAAAAEPEHETLTGPVHGELLELLPDDTVTGKESAGESVRELTPADLIDRFISISPTIERIKPAEDQPFRDLSERDGEDETTFITETLAKIYVNQGYYTKAINIYQKLSLQYPEKSAYFAGRIEKIEELIK